jgi:tRNA-dihydrouridine synthase 4
MEKRELVRDMVVETRERLRQDGWAVGKDKDKDSPAGRSVSVKIRVHHDLRKTIDFIDTVLGHDQDRHIDFLTIHPRTRNTPSSIPINLEALEILTSKYGDRVPILLSGDVFAMNALPFRSPLLQTENNSDAERRPVLPKLAGLMAARASLANPALYAGYDACPWEAVETFMINAARAPLPFKLTLHHVAQMCAPGMGPNKSALLSKPERTALMACANMCDLIDFLDEKRGLRRDAIEHDRKGC